MNYSNPTGAKNNRPALCQPASNGTRGRDGGGVMNYALPSGAIIPVDAKTLSTHLQREGLPAFRVTYTDGESYVTSMAKGVTLEDAKAYFVGQSFTQPDETTKIVTTVKALPA